MRLLRLLADLGAGLVAGLAAALLMTTVMAALRYALGIPPPAELFGDRVGPHLDVDTFIGLINQYGGYNQLKQLGAGSVIAGQLAVGLLIGLGYAALVTFERARRSAQVWPLGISRRGVRAVVLVAGLLYVLSLALLWPVLGISYRGLPPGPAAWATALALLVAYASYSGALLLGYRLMTSRTPLRRPAMLGRPIGRRAVVVGGVALALALASRELVDRLFRMATFDYDGMQVRGPDIAPITPNERFYIVTKNIIDPRVARPLWRLEIAGLVRQPRTYTFEELATLPPTTQETTLMCISNPVGEGLMSNAVWTGVPLRALIAAAGPLPGVVRIVLQSVDGYTDTVAFDKALEPTTLVAYAMNGEPLPQRHGYPVRAVVPNLYGEKSVKWLTRVDLVGYEAQGFYERQGWGPTFVVPTTARLDAPHHEQRFAFGPDLAVPLKGVAFAGERGVARVEVSFDDGRTWQQARLDYVGSPLAWVLWSHTWRPERPGAYRLVVRATDGTGRIQTPVERGTVPSGATGYHRITALVET